MKPSLQNWPWPATAWSDHIGFYLNRKGQLKLGNYQQYDIVHYVEKDKINKEMINILEELVWKK
jgi:putative methionine-R-sulfoxide reductase with GAF domain